MTKKKTVRNMSYGILSGVALFLVLGIPTALLPAGLFKRMTSPTGFDYLFLAVLPILFGYFIYLYIGIRKSMKKTCTAAGGLASGWLAVICPICVKLLVLLFGTVFMLTYFDPVRPVFGMASIVILIALIHDARKRNL